MCPYCKHNGWFNAWGIEANAQCSECGKYFRIYWSQKEKMFKYYKCRKDNKKNDK